MIDPRVHLFPVRHHSPTAARLVVELIRNVRPRAVLVEGPSDYNPQIAELALPHKLPIAIYTYAMLEDGRRRGAFYPFCLYSPEWQAIRAGFEAGAELHFIDLPWVEMAAAEKVEHLFSDHELKRSTYVARVAEKLGVETFDDVWDELVEIDRGVELDVYLSRADTLCRHLRELDGAGVREVDLRREAFMTENIRRTLAKLGGPIVVVTGGYHTPAIAAGLAERLEPAPETPEPDYLGAARGIALTPYSYEVLDKLTGYEAGVPNPGFYQAIFEDRAAGRADSFRALLFAMAEALRSAGQVASAADLIAVETTARALAVIRGHAEVWRKDLIDGIAGALVKDELALGFTHPMLEACFRVLRGGERGELAMGTSLPALVRELHARLDALGLTPVERAKSIVLELYSDADLEKSRLLHSLTILEIVGFAAAAESRVLDPSGAARLTEEWNIRWQPDFDASAIRASIYGSTILEAVAARLMEQIAGVERDAPAAASLLVDSARAGIEKISGLLQKRLRDLIATDGSFGSVAKALSSLVYLFRYDAILKTMGRTDIGSLVNAAYERALSLLESSAGADREDIRGVARLLEAFERCSTDLSFDRSALSGVLSRVAKDAAKADAIRGAALGASWTIGSVTAEDVLSELAYFARPAALGDFLSGLFSLAREVVQRRPDVVVALDDLIARFDRAQFLESLPGLRLAFSVFTPREKSHIAERVLEARAGLEGTGEAGEEGARMDQLDVPAEVAAEMMAFEGELAEKLRRWGVRGG